MRVRRLAAAIGLTGAAALSLVGARAFADPASSTATVQAPFGHETWYQPQPTCSTAIGCLPVTPPAINPYGAGTLHVAVSAGLETARTYLALGQVAAPAGGTLTGATLTVPLDTTTTDNGSLDPSTAHVQVCTSTAAITVSEGEFDDPPDTSCLAFAELTYSDSPAPELTGDLSPMLDVLSAGLATGKLDLALLPYQSQSTDAWHVVFSSHSRTSPPTAPASLSLTYTLADSTAPAVATEAPSPTAAPTTAAAAPTAAAVPTSGGTSLPPVTAPVAAGPARVAVIPSVAAAVVSSTGAAAPVVASQAPREQVAAQPAAATELITTHYLYPSLLLIPAVLLVLALVVVRLMTRDLTPARPRR